MAPILPRKIGARQAKFKKFVLYLYNAWRQNFTTAKFFCQ
jgi:hypothetical protein